MQLLFCLLPMHAHAAPPVILENGQESYSLGLNFDILEDKERKWVINDIVSEGVAEEFRPSDRRLLSFGFTKSAYWLRAKVTNKTGKTQRMILELTSPTVSKVDLYIPDKNGGYTVERSGNSLPFNNRKIKHRDILFDISFKPGESTILYVRAETDVTLMLPMKLMTYGEFIRSANYVGMYFGLVFGVLTGLILYNMFVYLSLRDKSYLFYVIFVSFSLFHMLVITGYSYQNFWPNSPWWANRALAFGGGGIVLFAALFARSFLGTKKILPLYDKFLWGVVAFGTFIVVSSFLWPDARTIIGITGLFDTMVGGPLVVFAGLLALLKGQRSARFFLLAWVLYMLSFMGYGLIIFGVIPPHYRPIYVLAFGQMVEAILLSLALADRISILRMEKEGAQAEIMEKERLLLKTIQVAKEELERKVEDRTTEYRVAKEQAEEATKLKDKFISLVSHDLRSPLSGIMMMLQMVLMDTSDPLNERKTGLVKRGVNIAEKMQRLIEQLLNMTMVQTGKIVPQKKFGDYFELVEVAVMKHLHLAEKKGITIESKLSSGVRVFADLGMLGEVVSNLVDNAIKFTDSGGRVVIDFPEEHRDTLVIFDTGIGISSEILPDIFKHEKKTVTKGTAGESGTGLGLPLCKDLIEAHGGTIWAESEEGKGGVFYIKLPKVRPSALLLVADETLRKEYGDLLMSIDMDVQAVASEDEALQKLREIEKADKMINVVVIDADFECEDNAGVLRAMKKKAVFENVSVMVLTADDERGFAKAVVGFRVDGVKKEPIEKNDFLQRVSNLI